MQDDEEGPMTFPLPYELTQDRPPSLVTATAAGAFLAVLVATVVSLIEGAAYPFPVFMGSAAALGILAVLVRARKPESHLGSGLAVVILALVLLAAVLAFGWVSLWDLQSRWARWAVVLLGAVAWFGLAGAVKGGQVRRRAVWLFSLASLAVTLLAFMATTAHVHAVVPVAAGFAILLGLAWGLCLPAIASAPAPSLLPTLYWVCVGAIGLGCLATSLLVALVYAPFFVVLVIVGIAWTLPWWVRA
jgi:hypothetical protein